MKPQLELKQITKHFKRQSGEMIAGLQDINLSVGSGEIIGIIGTNGAGKSTLLDCITGKTAIESGEIYLQGKAIHRNSAKQNASYISRVFQNPQVGTAPRMTVFENLMLASRRGERATLKRSLTHDNLEEMKTLLRGFQLDLDQRLDVPIDSLSGGQRQAIALVMATLKRPELLLLDEHTAALDPRTARQVMAMTTAIIQEQKLTALMVTHQLHDAIQYCDRIILMHQGTIAREYDRDRVKQLTSSQLYEDLEALQNMASEVF